MTTEKITNETVDETPTASTESPEHSRQRFASLSVAIEYGRRHAVKTAETIETISTVMGDDGVSPHPVDYAKYSLRELAKLREIIKESSFEAIKHAVETHGASVKELAEAAGISHTTIYRWMEESDREILPIPIRVTRPEPNYQGIPYAEFNNPHAVKIVCLNETRWLSLYGIPGSGKTNVSRVVVFGALLRGMAATVITGRPGEYRFAQNRDGSTVVSTKQKALKAINSILEDESSKNTRTPRVIIIDDFQSFTGETTSPSGSFLALTDALNTAIAKLISRADELNLHVVTAVQAASEDSADRSLSSEWREALDTNGFDESTHDRLFLSGAGRHKAVLHVQPTVPDRIRRLTVKLWDTTDQEALGRYLDAEELWVKFHGR